MDVQLQGRALIPIVLKQVDRFDKYGKPIFKDDAPLSAYRWGGQKRVISFDGTEMISNRHYIVDGQYDIEDGDILVDRTRAIPIKAFEIYEKLFSGNGTTVIHV